MKVTDSLSGLAIEKKYLLAVSGGVDSMVLMHLFYNSPYQFSVVHCNFQLRGEDSLSDEKLVREYCYARRIELFVKSFDTLKLKKNRESLEMVARNLRYDYFRELAKEQLFDYLVTAHHLNDNVETFFINLLRGSGSKGLSGMKKISDFVLRPLLSFPRKEIVAFAQENSIPWREDASNYTLEYLRNKIRHKIIPEFMDISSEFLRQVDKSMSILHETQSFIEFKVQELQNEASITVEEGIKIFSLDKLKKADFLLSYHLLSQYGFTNKEDCINIINSQTGNIFESNTFKVWIDRGRVLLEEKKKNVSIKNSITIKSIPFMIQEPVAVKLYEKNSRESNANEIVDLDKIEFPLTLRNWQNGDVFYPINGLGKKKVSKYLKDSKVSNFQKEKVMVLCNKSGEIIWLVGFRLDDRFKVSDTSKRFLHLFYNL